MCRCQGFNAFHCHRHIYTSCHLLVFMQNIDIFIFVEALEVEISEKIKHKQLPLDQVNNLVDVVLLASAGFPTGNCETKAVRLFTRQAVIDLWNNLENKMDSSSCSYITGDPGCGKSCVVWSWCCYKVTKGKTVLWIHPTDREKIPERVLLLNGFNDEDSTFMGTTYSYSVKTSLPKADILVLDGITEKNSNECFGWVVPKKYSCKFVVSSQQLQLKKEEDLKNEYVLSCWEKEDFIDALKNEALLKWIRSTPDVLPNSGTVEEIVDFKYFYAGRSARWMFQYTINDVKLFIGKHLDRCPNFDTLVTGMSGPQSSVAINHLISKLPDKTVDLISLYATQQLLKNTARKSIAEAELLLQGYPTCLGFLFEIKFLFRIRLGKEKPSTPIQLNGLDGNSETWGYNKEYTLDEFSFKDISTCAENDWIIPNWNQQAYDYVQIYELNNTASTTQMKLRFVQLTKASNHKFNPSSVQAFITEIRSRAEITDVDFVFVIPHSKLSEFKVFPQTQFTVRMDNEVRISHEIRILGWLEN